MLEVVLAKKVNDLSGLGTKRERQVPKTETR
jgi:hypothetical protein